MTELSGVELLEHRLAALNAIDEYQGSIGRLKRRSKRLRENMYNIAALPFLGAVVFIDTVQPKSDLVVGLTGAVTMYSAAAGIIISDILADRSMEKAVIEARQAANIYDENGITRGPWLTEILESDTRMRQLNEAV